LFDDAKTIGAVKVHLPKQRIVVFPEAEAKQSLQPK